MVEIGRAGVVVAAVVASAMAYSGAGCDDCQAEEQEPAAADQDPAPHNVLLIVVDTLRADHLGIYGDEANVSPNIDALARKGTRLTQVTSAASTTLASVTSLLTSRYTLDHGVYRNGVKWPGDLVGLQHWMREAGYETAGFVASHALHEKHGVARGFGSWDQPDGWSRDATRVTSTALQWLAKRKSTDRPFFALVHYFDPHAPYIPPDRHDLFTSDSHAGKGWKGKRAHIRRVRKLLQRRAEGAHRDAARLHACYKGEIHYVDAQVGRLLDGLAKRGLDEQTLVVFTADHGETMLEHRLFWKGDSSHFNHGFTAYQAEVHVPLILAGADMNAGRSIDLPVSNIDIAPTLLEILGQPVPDDLEGRSFAPWLTGDPSGSWNRLQYTEATKPHIETDQWPNRHAARAVVRGQWKAVHWPWRDDRWELYNLRNDPREQNDVWKDTDAAPEGMREQLAKLLTQWSEQRDEETRGSPIEDKELKQSLRALGYTQ